MTIIYGSILFLLGLVLGSFYNVVGIRIPQQTFFSTTRSQCPSCKQTLKWFELIPIVSYVIQNGTCRHCKVTISFLYPLVEGMTALGFFVSYLLVGFSLDLVIICSLISLFSIIVVTDLHYLLIPNRILLFFLPIFIVFRIIYPVDPWWLSIIGAVVGYGVIALIIFASQGGMGAGDMKLLSVLGILLGFPHILLCLFLATLLGLLFSSFYLFIYRTKGKKMIPFGPAIVLGAIITFLWGDYLLSLYVDMFFFVNR
ncbi:prepilin peptidase [Gracilibacillus sp. S3-1-1]|uniref:Prepilin peptidase n=1 Tax=Gracilibacillus pellucidus TaxID=3095368 RepID=A0ACC6M730_9BACI|nr:prepilin peptidase [Gracilibacillus sp. S3-1-1]MDX8046572.1 prepilin peptidase [Gracilibacillus sp. S3-1-1]